MTGISRLALTLALGTGATAAVAGTDPWAVLSAVRIDERIDGERYVVTKTFPREIEKGVKDFYIVGYAMPLSPPGEAVTELMLVSDMGNCPFCGSPDHGVSLQVVLDTPLPALEEGTRLALRGDLVPVTDSETWQAAVLKGARVVGS